MPTSHSAKRMIRTLPGLYKVTSLPEVDHTFFTAKSLSIFRSYLWDGVNRVFATEPDGQNIALDRAADTVKAGVYSHALYVDPATGQVANLGIDVDADLGTSWSLSFCLRPNWDTQPSSTSYFFPFRAAAGSNPSFGYREDNGAVQALGWASQADGSSQTLSHTLGWKPRELIVASLVVDAAAGTTKLYVNGVEEASLSVAIKADVTGTMRIHRGSTESGVTGTTQLEMYMMHAAALTPTQVTRIHQMFRTGLSSDSRPVRSLAAVAHVASELEDLAWKIHLYKSIDDSTGGALTRLALDFKVRRRADESDANLRKRVKDRLVKIFSDGTPPYILEVASRDTGLPKTDIVLKLNEDDQGNVKHAFFSVLLPPGNDAKLTPLDATIEAVKAAGVGHAVGVKGTFKWDGSGGDGWDAGAWTYTR